LLPTPAGGEDWQAQFALKGRGEITWNAFIPVSRREVVEWITGEWSKK
jgi:hypothetical protein